MVVYVFVFYFGMKYICVYLIHFTNILTYIWLLIDVPLVLDELTGRYSWAYFVFYLVVWQSSLSGCNESKFGQDLAGGSTEIRDLGT